MGLGEGDIFDKGLLFITVVGGGTADVMWSGDFWDIYHNTQLSVMSVMLPKLLSHLLFIWVPGTSNTTPL